METSTKIQGNQIGKYMWAFSVVLAKFIYFVKTKGAVQFKTDTNVVFGNSLTIADLNKFPSFN